MVVLLLLYVFGFDDWLYKKISLYAPVLQKVWFGALLLGCIYSIFLVWPLVFPSSKAIHINNNIVSQKPVEIMRSPISGEAQSEAGKNNPQTMSMDFLNLYIENKILSAKGELMLTCVLISTGLFIGAPFVLDRLKKQT
jgi:hypothetical protein